MVRSCISESSAMSVLIGIVGVEKAKEISATFGGESIYITRRIKPEGRDGAIKKEFNDMLLAGGTCMSSYRDLSHKHGLSERRIMAIIKG